MQGIILFIFSDFAILKIKFVLFNEKKKSDSYSFT